MVLVVAVGVRVITVFVEEGLFVDVAALKCVEGAIPFVKQGRRVLERERGSPSQPPGPHPAISIMRGHTVVDEHVGLLVVPYNARVQAGFLITKTWRP